MKLNAPKKYLEQQYGNDGLNRLTEEYSIALYIRHTLHLRRIISHSTLRQSSRTKWRVIVQSLVTFMASLHLHELITQSSMIPKEDVKFSGDYCVSRYTQSPLLSTLFGLTTDEHKPDVDKVALESGEIINRSSSLHP